MKVRISVVLDIGDPEKWKRYAVQGGRNRRVPDKRPLSEKLTSVGEAVIEGAQEYAGTPIGDAEIEVLTGRHADEKEDANTVSM
jgi:hypothetical protein